MQRLLTIITTAILLCSGIINTTRALTTSHEPKQNESPVNEAQKANQQHVFLLDSAAEPTDSSNSIPKFEWLFSKSRIRIMNLVPLVNHSGYDYAPTITTDGK